jgi:hypothetical protein
MADFTGSNVYGILANNNIADGTHRFFANGVNLNTTNIVVKNFYGNQTLTSAGSVFSDITTDDTLTCVRIFHGDLTINGFQLKPSNRVKGLFVYVKGKLTFGSGGSISMTGEGAAGTGANVYLATVGANNVFVPTNGTSSAGAQSATGGTSPQNNIGNTTSAAPGRETGGGGSGGAAATGNGITTASGSGSVGTSWSGGSGGGGAAVSQVSASITVGGTAGGAGGSALVRTGTTVTSRYAGAGAGPAAGIARQAVSVANSSGTSVTSGALIGGGSGGLLVVYARVIDNTSANTAFSSQGEAGGGTSTSVSAGGGGGGGGSVNVFHMFSNSNFSTSSINVTGGAGGTSSTTATGGSGGEGSKNIDQIAAQRLSLFVQGGNFYRYLRDGVSSYSWINVGAASGSEAERQAIFQSSGIDDFDLNQVTKAALNTLYNNNPTAVTIQTYIPS